MTVDIAENLATVRRRISIAEKRFHRVPGSVQLLAVSKTQSASAIRTAFNCGQRLFGESYLQEAQTKIQSLADLAIEWHFIGPIQSNKTKQIAQLFSWVHSIDREKIARRLDEQRGLVSTPLNVCLQVNVSNETTKSGIDVGDVISLARVILECHHLRLRGLMAIPAPAENFDEQCAPFRRLSMIAKDVEKTLNISLDTFSMGMSSDLEAAIAEGSTMVRVGTDIFGARKTSSIVAE